VLLLIFYKSKDVSKLCYLLRCGWFFKRQSKNDYKTIIKLHFPPKTTAMAFKYLLQLIPGTFQTYFKNKHFIIMFSTFLLLMIYGYHGNLDLLSFVMSKWSAPGVNTCCRLPIINGLPWDRELISFIAGFLLLVVVPLLIVTVGFKEPISKYGVLLPAKDKRAAGFFHLSFFGGCTWPGILFYQQRQIYASRVSFL